MIPFARRPWFMRRFAAALLAVAVLGLPACGDDNKGSVLPTSTATRSPTATEPVLPAAAKQKTREGAGAFARYFIAVFNYAVATGDTETFRSLSATPCKSCANLTKLIEDAYRSGSIRGGQMRIVEVLTPSFRPDTTPSSIVEFVRSAEEHLSERGDVVQQAPEVRRQWLLTLLWADRSWRVAAIRTGAVE